MFRKQDYIDKISTEDMEEGLKNINIGDLLFDPWFGFGIVLSKLDRQRHECQVKFYDKEEEMFFLDDDQVYFLKRNLTSLLKICELPPKDEFAKQEWNEMYCVF